MSSQTLDSKMTFEEAMKQLEGIVQNLERGNIDLEKAIDLYTQGEQLRSFCEQKLKEARLRIEQLVINKKEGVLGTEPFQRSSGTEGER